MRTFCKANAQAAFVSHLQHVLAKHSAWAFVRNMTTVMTPPGMIEITLDSQLVRVPAGTTIFDAARMNGVIIPTLCHLQNQTPVGVCRLCVVDTGARVLAASCVRPGAPDMKRSTDCEKELKTRKTLPELRISYHPWTYPRQNQPGHYQLGTHAKAART